jgi:hypothetical protein
VLLGLPAIGWMTGDWRWQRDVNTSHVGAIGWRPLFFRNHHENDNDNNIVVAGGGGVTALPLLSIVRFQRKSKGFNFYHAGLPWAQQRAAS